MFLFNKVHFHQYVIGYVDDNTFILTFRNNETAEEVLHEAQEELTIWKKLLQITGGNLELNKCVFLFFGWKLGNGYQETVEIKDSPGDIIMPNKVDNIQVAIKRREATEV